MNLDEVDLSPDQTHKMQVSRPAVRREKMRPKHPAPLGPIGYRAPSRTGRPSWWDEMKRWTLARKHLTSTPPVALDTITERLSTSLQASGYQSVYDMARESDVRSLLDVQGMGPTTLRKIRLEMIKRGIPVKWESPK